MQLMFIISGTVDTMTFQIRTQDIIKPFLFQIIMDLHKNNNARFKLKNLLISQLLKWQL